MLWRRFSGLPEAVAAMGTQEQEARCTATTAPHSCEAATPQLSRAVSHRTVDLRLPKAARPVVEALAGS